MEKKKKKLKTILISLTLSLVAVAGLTTAFLVNYNTYSPEKPVVLDDGSNIFISTSLNDNYAGYRFKFEGEEETIVINSKTNVISANEAVEEGVDLGKTYQISTCYLSKNEGNNSQFSDTTEWTCKAYLQKNTVGYNEETCKLIWGQVENADYYRVYFNNAEGGYVQTTTTELDLSTYTGGEMIVYVVSFSNNPNYNHSAKSNMLEFEHKHHFKSFTQLSFDQETCILTAKNVGLLEKLEITLYDADYDQTSNPTAKTTYQNCKFDVEKQGEEYVYKINLTTIYEGQTKIGLNPATIDEFNLFDGETVILDINA